MHSKTIYLFGTIWTKNWKSISNKCGVGIAKRLSQTVFSLFFAIFSQHGLIFSLPGMKCLLYVSVGCKWCCVSPKGESDITPARLKTVSQLPHLSVLSFHLRASINDFSRAHRSSRVVLEFEPHLPRLKPLSACSALTPNSLITRWISGHEKVPGGPGARMKTLVVVDFGRASRHIFALDNKRFGNASNTTKQSQWCVASPQWKPAQNVNRVLLVCVGGCYTHFDLFMSRLVSLVHKLSFLLFSFFRERSKAQNRLVWGKKNNNNTGETTNYEQSSNNTDNEPK